MLKRLILIVIINYVIEHAQSKTLQFELKGKRVIDNNEGNKVNGLEPQMDVFGTIVSSAMYNMRYYGQVSVGRPSRVFTVIFDTGSHVLWLPKINCKTDSIINHALCTNNQTTLYDPKYKLILINDENQVFSYSKTSRKLSKTFSINYGVEGDESSTHGDLYSDYFMFGDFNHPSRTLKLSTPVVFGVADHIVRLEKGIIGLGIPVANEVGTSIFDVAFKEGLLDKPLFTLFFKKCSNGKIECQEAGVITLGGIDIHNCNPNVIGWVQSFSYGGPWQYELHGLRVGNYSFDETAVVTSDSGSPLLHMPRFVVEGISNELGARKERGYLIIKCSRQFQIQLKINEQLYFLPNEQLTFNLGGDKCLLNIQATDSDGIWLLGTPMVRSFCHIHDWEKRRIGFSTPIQH